MPTRSSKPGLQPHRSPSILWSVRTRPAKSSLSLKSELLPQYTSDTLPTTTPWLQRFNLHLQYAQRITYRVLTDPELSQSKVFRFCAPIVVFLTLIAIIAVFPGFVGDSGLEAVENMAGRNRNQEWMYPLVILVSAVLGALSTLRLMIWITSFSVKLFVQENFSSAKRSSSRIFDGVMGGLFSG